MAEPTKRYEFAVRGGDPVISAPPTMPRVISLETGHYLWIGTDKSCFGWVDDLRTLRKLHAALGALIARRERKAPKKKPR